MDDNLQVFSFNCWGLAFVAKHVDFRLKEITNFILSQQYDIVTLQEVWVQRHVDFIIDTLHQKLPFAKYFQSGALGSGLVILSKFPIISTSYHRFALNGKPLKLLHGDYYVGKGVASALVQHPILGSLEIFNTHLHGGYGPKDRYKAHRVTESWQLASLLRHSVAMNRHVILSGDFNSIPGSSHYQLICHHGFLSDSWLQIHGEPDPQLFDMNQLSSDYYTQYFGFTCNSPFNSFSRYYKGGLENAKKLLGKRLDYIFYLQTPQMDCIDSSIVLTEFIPNTEMCYSDHFGVVSIFRLSNAPSSCTNSLSLVANPNYTHLSSIVFDDLLNTLQNEQLRASKNAATLIYTLALCSLLWIVLYILLIVLKQTLSRALIGLFMSLFAGLIPICLIVGFVFGETEKRTLAQFLDEIKTFKASLYDYQ